MYCNKVYKSLVRISLTIVVKNVSKILMVLLCFLDMVKFEEGSNILLYMIKKWILRFHILLILLYPNEFGGSN